MRTVHDINKAKRTQEVIPWIDGKSKTGMNASGGSLCRLLGIGAVEGDCPVLRTRRADVLF